MKCARFSLEMRSRKTGFLRRNRRRWSRRGSESRGKTDGESGIRERERPHRDLETIVSGFACPDDRRPLASDRVDNAAGNVGAGTHHARGLEDVENSSSLFGRDAFASCIAHLTSHRELSSGEFAYSGRSWAWHALPSPFALPSGSHWLSHARLDGRYRGVFCLAASGLSLCFLSNPFTSTRIASRLWPAVREEEPMPWSRKPVRSSCLASATSP